MKELDKDVVIIKDPYANLVHDEVEDDSPTVVDDDQQLTEPVSLEQSMLDLDNISNLTKNMRMQLLAKLTPTVMSMDMDLDHDDLELVEAKARAISEYRALVNDLDSSAKNVLGAKLKLHGIESQNASSKVVAAVLLSQINASLNASTGRTNTSTDLDDADALLEQRAEKENLVVLDTELEVGGHMLPKKKTKDEFD